MSDKVVLAYSGGLDTSVAIQWLKEKYNLDVIAVTVDVGNERDFSLVRQKALKVGAIKAVVIDAKETLVNHFIFPALQADAVYEGQYPLATALSRPLIAKLLVDTALKEKASAVAHGCTGKGNDQVRIEVSVQALAPELRTCVRPVFRVVLKGSDEESTISQVVWQKDTAAITNVSLGAQRLIPGDEGSLKVTLGTRTVRLDHANRTLTIGRGSECDLVVTELFASRQHLRIRLLRTHFYLFDQSINGTFVTLDNGKEVQVLRGELLLEGSGSLALGRSAREGAADIVSFARDRRSIYRVA